MANRSQAPPVRPASQGVLLQRIAGPAFVAAALLLVFSRCGPRDTIPTGATSGERLHEPSTRFPEPPRIVAIGDLHGDLGATRRALRLAGAIDGEDRWTGDDLVVVQTGDQLDRGDDDLALLALLGRLSRQAGRSGGALHILNGNHELMNVQGKFSYVTPDGFSSFDAFEWLNLSHPFLLDVPEAQRSRMAAFRPGGPWTHLLARRNVVEVIGGTVFVHGGVLPHVARYGLERLNAETRRWLRGEAPEPPEVLLPRDGPVWSRHFSDEPDGEDCALLAESLRIIGALRMVVGHTVQEDGIRPSCDDLVWRIDVGLSAHYGGETSVLEIEGDRVRALVAAQSTDPADR